MYNTIRLDGFTNAPACPSSHPVRMPQVTFETVWDTTKFNSMWPSGAPNPFVWSFEGTSGFGTHADYMFGWKGDSLQRAMDKSECFYDGCGSIKKQAMQTANKCTIQKTVGEEVDGCKFPPNSAETSSIAADHRRARKASRDGDVKFLAKATRSYNSVRGDSCSLRSLRISTLQLINSSIRCLVDVNYPSG